jgi:methylmalonyl-CoA mutase
VAKPYRHGVESIAETMTSTQAMIDSRAQIIVGLNKYTSKKQEEMKVLKIDNTAVREAQMNRLRQLKAERDASKVEAALIALTECARTGQGNLLDLSIQARAKATVGEISYALEKVFGRHKDEQKLVSGVYVKTFGEKKQPILAVEEKVAQFVKLTGHKPRIFICKLGQDGHDRGQEVVGAAFSDLGFDVVLGPLFQTPDEAAKEAVEKKADVVGPSSLAAGHLTLVLALRKALDRLGRNEMPIVIGGVIPPQDYDELYKDGVLAIFGPGTVIPDSALKVLQILETKSVHVDAA